MEGLLSTGPTPSSFCKIFLCLKVLVAYILSIFRDIRAHMMFKVVWAKTNHPVSWGELPSTDYTWHRLKSLRSPGRSCRTHLAGCMASVPRNSWHRFMVVVDLSIKERVIDQCCPWSEENPDNLLGVQRCNPSLWGQNQRLGQCLEMELMWQQIWQWLQAQCSQGQWSQRQVSNSVVTKSVIKSIEFPYSFF